MKVIKSRNVNEALNEFLALATRFCDVDGEVWRDSAPRGLPTKEWPCPVATVYERPHERVLFNTDRDANPFFHLMESLWILAGRDDVAFLTKYNKHMANFSDDGKKFHAPYGARLRRWRLEEEHTPLQYVYIDQVRQCIEMLRNDHDSRQAVMSIWNPVLDLNVKTKDVPCNDLVMLKIRNGHLNMTVACRSNDVVWGAYGANVVQFSTLLEFMARALSVNVGTYTQVSDSYHYYTDNEAMKRMLAARKAGKHPELDPYKTQIVKPYPLMSVDYEVWLHQCELFCDDNLAIAEGIDPFFVHVAEPMKRAWEIYHDAPHDRKHQRIVQATQYLFDHCHASDWTMAGIEWLRRRDK